MRIRLILLACLGLAACAPPTPPAAPRVQREVPFTISTIGETWEITGRFAGTARIHADRVELLIPEAEIQYSSNPNLRLGGIYVGLASTLPSGSWDITGQTAPVPISSVFRDGSKTASDTLRFTIAAPAGIDLSRHWIVIGMTETTANDPDPRPGHSFAHSAKDIFRE
jgi:hypothetical protein